MTFDIDKTPADNFGRNMMESLADKFPQEQERVRSVLGHYKELGVSGAFGAAMIERSLKLADKAAMSGDLAEMIIAYKNLQKIE